jgi:hypothetical protein
MELQNERNVEMVEFDIDLTLEESQKLYDIGLTWLKEDTDAVINYAINKILKNMVEDQKDVNKLLRKEIKKKNGKG